MIEPSPSTDLSLFIQNFCNGCVQKSSYYLGQYASQAKPLSGPYKFKAGHITKQQIIYDSEEYS